ncbi:signal peptidase I [Micrococcales bacterium 31B]|nr:signal peptidase I [Micrococcales bacterium 31B]
MSEPSNAREQDSPREQPSEHGAESDAAARDDAQPAVAAAETRAERRERKKSRPLRVITESVVLVAIALVVSMLIKTFLLQPFYIPSESMYNTMLKDDKFMVSKLTPEFFELKRGDIVVFKAPADWMNNPVLPDPGPVANALSYIGLVPQDSQDHWVKRVIGLPGDHVTCCTDGKLVVNGVEITEPYLYPGSDNNLLPFDITLQPGYIWVEGDNRDSSEDSRYQMLIKGVNGQLPMSSIVGKAEFIYWPLSRWQGLGDGEAAFAGVPAPQ